MPIVLLRLRLDVIIVGWAAVSLATQHMDVKHVGLTIEPLAQPTKISHIFLNLMAMSLFSCVGDL